MLTWMRKAGFALLLSCSALPSGAETLADALVQAYKTNPQLRAQQAALRSVQEDVISARANLLPALTQSFSIDRTKNYALPSRFRDASTIGTLNTQLTLQLFDGGADQLAVQSRQMAVRAARQALVQTEQTVLLATVQAYMNVRRDQQFIRLAQNNVRVLKEQVRAAEDRFDVGEVTRTDVAQAEARYAAALSQLELNRGTLQRSINSYVAVVGKAPKDLRNPPAAPKIPNSVKKAEALAMVRHPRILQAQHNAKAAELLSRAAGKNRKPTINGELSHSLRGTAGDANLSANALTARITGNWTLYQGGRLDSNRRKQVALWQQSLANVQQSGYITRQSIRNAFSNWQVAGASIKSNRELVRAAQVAYDGVREEAKLGARTTLDALDAEQELLTARSNLVTAIRDQYVAQYEVLAEMGLLTAKHLNLGVETYDPDLYSTAITTKQNNPLGLKRSQTYEKILKRNGN